MNYFTFQPKKRRNSFGAGRRLLNVFFSLIFLLVLFSTSAQAATKTWNTTTGGAWTTGANWSPTGAPAANDDVIINSNQSASITAMPTISLNSLNVSGNCRLEAAASGNTLTITGTLTVASTYTLSLGNTNTRVVFVLASTATGTINGTGIINFDAGSTQRDFTVAGDLTIAPGALITDQNGGTGSYFILSASGTLRIGNTAGITTTGATGAIQLTGTRTYTAGADYEYNGSAAQVTGNGLTQNTAANLTINNSAGVTLSAATTTSGLLTMQSGTLNMANLNLTVGSLTGTGAITNSSGTAGARTLTVGSDNTSPAAYSGVISNGTATSVALTKNGTGTLTLSGSNSFTGLTTISAGTIKLGAAGTSPNSPLGTTAAGTSITAGGVLDLNGFTLPIAEPLTLRGTGISNGGSLTNSSATSATYSGLITLGAAASIVTNSGDIVISNASTIAGATFGLTIGGTGNGSIASIIGTTTGTLTKIGTGAWTLSGNNTFTGLTTISAGTLKLGSAGSGANTPLGTIGAGTLVSSGGTLDLKGFTLTTAEAITINGSGSAGAGAITNSSATNVTYSGLITLGSTSTITTNNGTISFSNTGTIGGATFGLVLDGTQTNSSSITGIIGTTSGTVTKNGVGTWTLIGASTYTGLTNINAGTLRIGSAGSGANTPLGTVSSGTVVASGASLDLNGYTLATAEALTINGTGVGGIGAVTNSKAAALTYSGLLSLGSPSSIVVNYGAIGFTNTGTITGAGFGLTLDGSTTSSTSSIASIIGTTSGNVIKDGNGYWTLSGANTFTGGVTLNAGRLNINNTNALGTSAGTFTINSGEIDNSTASDITTVNYPLIINGSFDYIGSTLKGLDLGTGATQLNSDITINISAGVLSLRGPISATAYNFVKGAQGTLNFGANDVSFKAFTLDQGLLNSTTTTLHIGGDFTNNGTFTNNGGTVNLIGSSPQIITGGNSPTFEVLKINNASGVSLASQTITTTTLTIGDEVANSLFVDAGNQIASTGTLNLISGTLRLGAGTATEFPAFATVNISTGTTVDYAAEATQTIKGMTYSILTLSGTGNNFKSADGDITVNKTLNLNSSNASTTQGCLNMVTSWNSYPVSRDESSYTLYMGATATTLGVGDVTGIIRRNTIVANTSYTFGNQYTSFSLTTGTMPSSMTVIVKIGAAAPGKTDAVSRHYEIIPPGASGCFLTGNFHYLDAELNGNTEAKLTTWDYDIGGGSSTPDEHGRASFDFTNNYVGLSNIPISYFIQSWRTIFNLGDHQVGYRTWTGTYSTDWNNSSNWFPYGVPTSLTYVIIPDSTTTNYDPHLPSGTTSVNTLSIEEGGSLIMGSNTLVINNSLSGGWEDQNLTGNDPGNSTVVFSRPGASVSGVGRFHNVQIADTATVTLETGATFKVDNTFTKTGSGAGKWYADIFDGTVEYNGGSQSILMSDATPNYHHLILSGSGTKTFPSAALDIHGNLELSGSASTTPGYALTIGNDLIIGSGTTFTGGSLNHQVGKDFNNSGTFNAGSGTITFNGEVAQAITGSTATTFYNLTLTNALGLQAMADVTIDHQLTLSSGSFDVTTYNLTFNSSAAAIAGTFDTTTMIIADEGGEVRKNATNASQATYFFPIGDNAASANGAEYSPLDLSFSSGTFAGYVGVKVANSKHPNNGVMTDYLNRYWSVSTSGISSPVYNFTANYLTVDVQGDENSIASAIYTGSLPWTKYAPANTSTHAVSGSALSATTIDISGINEVEPTVSITGGGGTTCESSTVNLGTSITAKSAVDYLWSTAQTTASISVNPTTTTLYSVTITDANGFTATASSTVTVSTNPTTAAAGSNQSACASGTVLAANTPSVGTGVWSISSGPSTNLSQISNVNNPTATFIPIGGYGVYHLTWTISNSPCNSSSSNVNISIFDGPWLGTVSSDWTDPNNWCGGVPTSATNVTIANGASHYPIITTTEQVNTISIESAGSITITGGNLKSGAITNNGSITVGSSGTLDMGTSQMSGTGALVISGTFKTSKSDGFSGTSTSAVSTTIGTLTLNSSSTIDYSSTATQTISARNYANLSNSGDGARIFDNNGIIGIAGSFTTGSGNYTVIGSALEFNGTLAAQVIPAFTPDSTYYNLVVNNVDGVSIGADLKLTDSLTIIGGDFTTTGHNFTLLSTSAKTARIAPILNGGNIIGDITMQRFVPGSTAGWVTMGMPVGGATLAQWNDDIITTGYWGSTTGTGSFVSVYSYLESAGGNCDDYTAYVPATSSSDVVNPKAGYFVFVGDNASQVSDKTIDVTGTPLVGTQDMNISYTSTVNADEDGWNLIENPYPSAIDWNSPDWTKTNVDNAIYVYNADNAQYIGSVDGVPFNGGSTLIPSSQAFFVHANSAGAVLLAEESVKKPGSPVFHKMAFATPSMLKLKLDGLNGMYYDETIFRTKAGASNNFDTQFDAYKLLSFDYAVPNIMSKLDGVEYVVNTVNELTTNFDLPIRLNVNTPGDYTISFEGLSSFTQVNCFTFEDKLTHTTLDLRMDSSYSFTSAMDTAASSPRFVIHFGVEAIAAISPSATTVSLPGNGTVNFSNLSQGAVSYSWNFGDGSALDTTANPSHTYTTTGVYTVSLTASNSAGCSQTANIDITVDDVTGTIPEFANETISIEKDINGFYLKSGLSKNTVVNASIFNAIGAQLASQQIKINNPGIYKLDYPELSKGIYLIEVQYDNHKIVKKIVF